MALARLHRRLETDAAVTIAVAAARAWDRSRLTDVIVGAGFEADAAPTRGVARVRRRISLPDTVGAAMNMLVCGLNPSVHAAEVGIGFGRPGNRFWPAALASGLVTVDRDPDHALTVHGIGMTDIVKRATPRAAELTATEYSEGMARLDRLVRWLEPEVITIVGLAGWRAAVDPEAAAGLQSRAMGGRPVYLMPSTSGLNAHSRLEDLTDHFSRAAAITR